MRRFGGWTVAGLVALLGVVSGPASAQGSAAPVAGIADNAALRAARWVVAARVRLRGGPSTDAAVLGGLEVNTPLTLRATAGEWCDIERGDGVRGYVACRFLDTSPVDLDAISQPRHDGAASRYDPARAFALLPTWDTFATYAFEVDRRQRASGHVPDEADATLVAMEEELAMGAYGPVPPVRTDVAALKRRVAAASRDEATVEARRAAADSARDALQLWADPFYEDGERALAVAASLSLPPVRPSYFAAERDLAAGSDTPDALSGRFGIVHRWVMRPAKRATTPDGHVPSVAGYDSATHLLVRPLQRVQLFADGTLAARASHARRHQPLADEGMCPGWTPGFALGGLHGADSAWRFFDEHWPDARKEAAQPAGALYAFYVAAPLPRTVATVTSRAHALDRIATGFASATSHVFDVDHDAVPDLLVWEATGPGPGHMDGPTATDDTWYRLVLVNIAGRWKILGTDQFSYGCGC